VAAAIDSVLGQTWPNLNITLIDDGSTDETPAILADYAEQYPHIRLKRNRHNGGAIANFQRAFWFGNADFVLPKSADDLIMPDFVERMMDVLLANPATAMCHAGGLVFTAGSDKQQPYPTSHALHAVGPDRLGRVQHVMARYTSSPSFWGVYRRAAVDQLSQLRFRAGWDHVVLAELALYGEIRHVPEPLYWRRDGGKPVAQLARASTEQGTRGIPLDGLLADQRWRTPLITTAYAHLEAFAAARLPQHERLALMESAVHIFNARWPAGLQREADALKSALPALVRCLVGATPLEAQWLARHLADLLRAVETILPHEDLTLAQLEIAALAGDPTATAEAA
jgi:hypothetical protein